MLHPVTPFINQIICGEAILSLRRIPSESVDCVVTSPPYWGLRDYGVEGQLGIEADFRHYINRLCDTFDEVKRVLKKTGTCWVNLGDTYSTQSSKLKRGHITLRPNNVTEHTHSFASSFSHHVLPRKCLLQIPGRFAVEMINRGWTLRNEIVWHKPNCMPESVKDRFTVDFEKIFFFVKSRQYYFRQQFEPLRATERLARRSFNPLALRKRIYGEGTASTINPRTIEASRSRTLRLGRNKRCVWQISARPYRGDHFAVYPQQLIETPIKAGCPPGGIVLDPFMGSGTTAVAAKSLGRRFIGIELNRRYVRMAKKRLQRMDE